MSGRLRLQFPDIQWAEALFACIDSNRARLEGPIPWTRRLVTQEAAKQYLQEAAALTRGGQRTDCLILEYGNLVGGLSLFRIDDTHKHAELGYWLIEEAEGRGLMFEACTQVLNFAFQRRGLHRISAQLLPDNARSIRLLERLGFLQEACLREQYWYRGEVQDIWVYGLLAGEFFEKTKKP